MSPRRQVAIGFGALLAALLAFSLWNPGQTLSDGLRDNFVSDFFTGLITLLFFDQALEAVQRHREAKERSAFAAAATQTLDHDTHALWSLLTPTLDRDDPLRREEPARRVERFVRELSDASTWNAAPAAHAGAVRARIRDLGEDADRLRALGERAEAPVATLARLEALREASRAFDEDWESIPRGELGARFATTIAPEIEGALAGLSSTE